MTITGNIIDIKNRTIYPGKMEINGERIISIEETKENVSDQFILPGFIDAHVHIESSMLVPTEFARMAVVHGTVATVSDPHEIGNVLGIKGVEFMIANGKKSPFKFNFGAPSCVPATTFETAGAIINSEDVAYLLKKPEIKYLAEMMNWPGVLFKDEEVLKKIAIAKELGKPVDGHAPGLMGDDAKKYIEAGISTDHECFTAAEALNKLQHGMKIIIREGSAAKNFEALIPLAKEYAESMMFCSDDKHPDSLEVGHINQLVKRALAKDHDLFDILKMACINPIEHYNLDVGMLRVGDYADFIVIDNLKDFNIVKTFINGELMAEQGISKLNSVKCETPNNFNIDFVNHEQFLIPQNKQETIPVIEVIDGELITKRLDVVPTIKNDYLIANPENDLLKMVVVNRYKNAKPAMAFVKNFGIQEGAIASSVAHDSHNIIAVGTDDRALEKAINLVIKNKGGLSANFQSTAKCIPLPIAGLMGNIDGYQMAKDYIAIDQLVKKMGSKLISPYMSLSFMALLVIPSIKLSDLGLFDGTDFKFIDWQ